MHQLWPEVERSLPQLWRAACGYESNPESQKELFQEILLAIWECLPSLRDRARLMPFALRVAHNVGASHVRSATRRPTHVDIAELSIDAPQASDEVPTAALFAAIRALPVTLRQPLMLHLEGFDYGEIADFLDISIENVGVRLHRARAEVKRAIDTGDAR